MIGTYRCAHCQDEFRTTVRTDKRVLHCSKRCKEASRRVFSDEQIREIAAHGVALSVAAELAGTTGAHRVKQALKRAGLYEQWREQRFA